MRESHRLVQLLTECAARGAEDVALRGTPKRGARETLTFRALLESSARVANGFARRRGQVVLLSAPNSPRLVLSLLGALRAGVRVLLLPADLPAAALANAGRSAGAELAVGFASDLRLRAAGLPFASWEALEASEGPGDFAQEGSILLPTSGSTGSSKLVERDANSLCEVGQTSARAFGLGAADRCLLAIPLCHSYGVDQLFACLASGACVDLHAGFSLGGVRRALCDDGISAFPGVPLMLDLLSRGETLRAPGLRRVFSAGSPLPLRVFDRFLAVTGVPIGQFYGATEFGSITYNDPNALQFEPLSVGPAIGATEIRVVDPARDDPHAQLGPGEEGRVAVRGPTLLAGYANAPSPLRDGWLVTGDLGALDALGRLRISGRTAFVFDVGGKKVNPAEVERVLGLHPAVREAVVLPGAASDTVERIWAVIVPEPGEQPDPAELRRFAATQLPPHMIPRRFELRAEPPRSASGKILRTALRSESARS